MSSFYVSSVYAQLTDFANLSNFWSLFNTAFGSSYDSAKAANFKYQWQSGNFSLFPQIEVVSNGVLGTANGAYAISTNKIYLSDAFISSASQQSLEAWILEEFGHFVDAQVNSVDSAGDEGAIFAALVAGESLDAQILQALKAEDDHAVINLNGQAVLVEQANLTGTNGNDTITGTSSNDTINSCFGVDTVDGGDGNDLLIVDYSSNTYNGTSPNPGGIYSSIYGGGFNGYYQALYNPSYYDQVSFINIERLQITGTLANDNIYTGDGDDTIVGGAGNDTLAAFGGNNSINGGDGNDVINSGTGNDTINAGAGDDVITGGTGINVIDGGAGIDTLFDGNFGSATTALNVTDTTTANAAINLADGTSVTNIERFTNLMTGSGNDVINYSQRINNNFSTGAGNDTINSCFGVDTVDGGDGNDLLIVDYSSNTYNGTSPNPGGIYSSIYGGGFNGYYQALYNPSYYDQVSFINIERLQITGTLANDNIYTGDGDDTIVGGAGNDTLAAFGGNDILLGVNVNNLNPGIGERDTLNGGSGADKFILGDSTWIGYDDGLTTNAGTNDYAEIADFNTSENDVIQLRGGVNYLLTVVGADTQLFIDKPNAEPDELIAIIKNRTGLSLTGSYFVYNQTLPNITLALAPASVLEDGTPNLVYTFTRTGAITNALTVNYGIKGTATNGTDYATIGTSVTFTANSATATVIVNPTADTAIENNETVALTLATGTSYTIGTTTAVTGTITDDDKPRISLSLDYSGISEDSPSNFIYTFTRTGATTNSLTVNYSIAGTALSTDYTGATPGTGKTITFAAGSATATLTLDPTADTTLEPNETVILQLVSGTGYTIVTTAAQTATIINDDNTRNQKGINGNSVLLGKNYSDYLTGGTSNDILNGADSGDYLTGAGGNDTLTGGSGSDTFFFANANLGTDTITDFTLNEDTIFVSAQGFGSGLIAGNPLTETQFILGSSATSASQRFIYNSTNGALLFDADGNGLGTAKQIATLSIGLALTAEDIFVG